MKNVSEVDIANATPISEAKAELPKFEPRWWYSADKLDGRPVLWSLKNHPEEWFASHGDPQSALFILDHTPSGHRFDFGWGAARLYEANCGCNSGGFRNRFQRFQSGGLKRAARTFYDAKYGAGARNAIATNRERFRDHFVK